MRSRRVNLLAFPILVFASGATFVVDDVVELTSVLASAEAGDTVLVRPGVYVGSLVVPGQVSLVGSGPESTVLDGGRADWVLWLDSGANVRGFTITGGRGGIVGEPSTRITGNVIAGNSGRDGAGIATLGCGVLISSNIIRDNHAPNSGGGMWVTHQDCQPTEAPPMITNNLIVGNTAHRGSAIHVTDLSSYDHSSRPIITHNTLVGNAAAAVSYPEDNIYIGYGTLYFDINTFPVVPTGRLTNNVIAANTGGGVRTYTSGECCGGPLASHNVFFDNGTPAETDVEWGDGNVLADPLLRDVPGGDYRLQAGSPAIDTAEALAEPLGTDLDGFPRSLDGDLNGLAPSDLGAYEETGEVAGLLVAADTMSVSWDPRAGATTYNLYRGSLPALRVGGEYTQDPGAPLTQQWCGLSSPAAFDPATPLDDEIFFYLATPVGPEEGTLGFNSLRQTRPNAHPCP